MSVGLQVFGSDGRLQFDSDCLVYTLVASGTHNTSTNSSGSPIGTRSRLDVTITTSPLVAFRPQTVGMRMAVYAQKDASGFRSYYIMADGSGLIDWWQFDLSTTFTDTYGFVVYDATGQVLYHSSKKPMRIVDVGPSISGTEPSGSTYAIVAGTLSGQRRWLPVNNTNPRQYYQASFWNAIGRPSSNQITTFQTLLDQSSNTSTTQGPVTTYGPGNFMLVDVSNY